MEIAKGVNVKFESGKASLEVEVSALVAPAIASFKAKVASGEIDLIKGTDLDKDVLIKAADFIQEQLEKKLV